jgi:hypothetical protein
MRIRVRIAYLILGLCNILWFSYLNRYKIPRNFLNASFKNILSRYRYWIKLMSQQMQFMLSPINLILWSCQNVTMFIYFWSCIDDEHYITIFSVILQVVKVTHMYFACHCRSLSSHLKMNLSKSYARTLTPAEAGNNFFKLASLSAWLHCMFTVTVSWSAGWSRGPGFISRSKQDWPRLPNVG